MKFDFIGNIAKGQDGAIWDKFLFRFDANGSCTVYDIENIENGTDEKIPQLSRFLLDKAEVITPHSNSVVFGSEFYCVGDEFPLLYTNIYNNYASSEDKLKGVCCVYRIVRNGAEFSSELVQLIRIGFTEDSCLWCSSDKSDVRPYGNFVVDRECGKLYVFTMRDENKSTRYFSFDIPKYSEGTIDEKYGINSVILCREDIREYFDCEYHRFVQGACVNNGLIYSLEGFSGGSENPPMLRIADPKNKTLKQSVLLENYGLVSEPEFIDFTNGVCYYSDNGGKLYTVTYDA